MKVVVGVFTFSFLFLYVIGFGLMARADHPNEGKVAITQLIDEAEQNSLELKQAEENIKALRSNQASLYGRFSPKISIEGGPKYSKYDGETSSATALYGKAEWNLYNGGSDKSSLDLQKSEIETQEKRYGVLKNRIRKEVSKIYYELQFVLESISLKEKALKLNTQQMKIAKAKNSSGLTTSSDVLEFDLRESTIQSDLVLLNQQLEQKSRELDVLLSRKNQASAQAVKGHLLREILTLNRAELISKIKNTNEQLLLSKLEVQKSDVDRIQARSQFLPKIELEARYGKLATDEKVFSDNNNYNVMLKFNLPLFSGFEDYNFIKSVNSKVVSAKLSFDQKNISIIADLDESLGEIKALNQRLDLEEKNLERSEKYYKLTLEEYRRGVKNSPDMVGASERLLEARIRNLEYRRDLMLAKAKIQELTGE